MNNTESPSNLVTSRVISALYVEAMVMADEARSYFDSFGKQDRDHLKPMQRVSFSCESLKVTTRLMHVIAWLLTQRSIACGELDPATAISPSLRLGEAAPTDPQILNELPGEARALIDASVELYNRVKRLDNEISKPVAEENHAHLLQNRIAQSF